jgi:hypothetical protein
MGSIGSIPSTASLAASTATNLAVDVGFTTTVAGKTYDAGVTYSGSEYIAVDPSVNGAMATGESVTSAESNLSTRIDALV